jgi:hypothetical protein
MYSLKCYSSILIQSKQASHADYIAEEGHIFGQGWYRTARWKIILSQSPHFVLLDIDNMTIEIVEIFGQKARTKPTFSLYLASRSVHLIFLAMIDNGCIYVARCCNNRM